MSSRANRNSRKLRDFVSARDFGAVGDGVVDDTAAIQAAINSLSYGTVLLPSGGLFLVSGLTLKPGVALVSTAAESATLLAASNGVTLLRYEAPIGPTPIGITVENLRLWNNGKTNCAGVLVDGTSAAVRVSKVRLSNMAIEGQFDYGIFLRFCANTFISNIFIALAEDGVRVDNCADTDIHSVKVQNGSGWGFYVSGGPGAFDEGVRLTSCTTNGQHYGLGIEGQEWGVASSCSFTTAPGGPLVTVNNASNWRFSSCEFATAGANPNAAAVNLENTTVGFSFASCQMSNSTFGAAIRGAKHMMSSCYLTANSNVDIALEDVTSSSIIGNVCDSTGPVSHSILESSAANNNAIIGNLCQLSVTTVGANTVSANNILY